MIVFYLEWFDFNEELIVGEARLSHDVTEDEVRVAFGLAHDEYPGDCLKVAEQHLDWLKSKVKVPIELSKFEYFVSITEE